MVLSFLAQAMNFREKNPKQNELNEKKCPENNAWLETTYFFKVID